MSPSGVPSSITTRVPARRLFAKESLGDAGDAGSGSSGWARTSASRGTAGSSMTTSTTRSSSARTSAPRMAERPSWPRTRTWWAGPAQGAGQQAGAGGELDGGRLPRFGAQGGIQAEPDGLGRGRPGHVVVRHAPYLGVGGLDAEISGEQGLGRVRGRGGDRGRFVRRRLLGRGRRGSQQPLDSLGGFHRRDHRIARRHHRLAPRPLCTRTAMCCAACEAWPRHVLAARRRITSRRWNRSSRTAPCVHALLEVLVGGRRSRAPCVFSGLCRADAIELPVAQHAQTGAALARGSSSQ